MLREIILLRKFSTINGGTYTTKLYDIILPDGVIIDANPKSEDTFGSNLNFESVELDLQKLTHIFLILEKCELSLRDMLDK